MMLVTSILLCTAVAITAKPTAQPRATSGSYAMLDSPSRYQSPRFRYWWPGGWIQPAKVVNEVRAIAAAGFGGAEIADVRDSIDVPMDTSLYGWAQPLWNAGVDAAYDAAKE